MPNTNEQPVSSNKPGQNRLAREKSPYLLQHADNPVDWYPWGEEAFELARREDKPVFLSIGYSSCHWCHVMEHESFEDEQVAALMNEAFVNIKVDREERPDIDDVYMTVAQLMSGRGGWPLNIIMTPDKVPFLAATYIPKNDRFGQAGMLTLVPAIQERWRLNRDELLDVSKRVQNALQQLGEAERGEELGEDNLRAAYEQLDSRFDKVHGGFGKGTKFPTPHNLLFLLRYWNRSGEEQALRMVEQTLQAMRNGGVFDHVGLGFHRYSTDPEWLLPHFEKMLYDQAMLVMAYTEAYQATGKQEYRQTAEEIVAYVLRDMLAQEGGFFSAEDADSEGEEGKFYVWTRAELDEVLGEEADLVARLFNVQPEGNYADEATREKTGANILHRRQTLGEVAEELGITEQELARRVEVARQTLFAHREQRVHPLKDDKVLTDWNGLMIAALAQAARVFDEPAYAEAAERAAGFLLDRVTNADGRLLHRYREGEAALLGYAADYAFLTWGLLELYETTFEVDYLETASRLTQEQLERFWDAEGGGFFTTADDAEELLVRHKESYDGAVPSANSVGMWNLLRLGRILARPELEEKAAQLGRAFSNSMVQAPMAYTQWLIAVGFALGPSYEVVIVGEPGALDTQAMLRALRGAYVPNKVVVFRPDTPSPDITEWAPYTAAQRSLDGKATAYVCQDHVCQVPATAPEEMLAQLEQG